jgi:hypothetical protein
MQITEFPSNDEILSGLDKGSAEPAQSEPIAQESAQTPEAPAQPDYKTLEYEYSVEGGKKIKENLEMILKRAGLGYHYAQRAQGLNQLETEFKTKEQTYQEQLKQYEALKKWQEYEDFAKQNPDWAKHVEQSWLNREQPVQSNIDPTISTKLQELQSQLSDVSTWKQGFEAEKQKQVQAQEDQALGSEIENVAKKFSVDLSLSDEQGASLEWRVLDHMKKMGLSGAPGHFTMAFKDYHFDNLVKLQKDQALEAQTKDGQTLRKNGILARRATPSRPVGPPADVSKLSYEQLIEMAKQDKSIFG